MQDDPIRAALDASAKAVTAELERQEMSGDYVEPEADAWLAAAAIAAFLRAMGPYTAVVSPRHIVQWNTVAAQAVAAAVERAAREDDDAE